MPYRSFFVFGLLIALVPALVRHYLLWPFPGSQDLNSVAWAYRLSQWTLIAAVVGLALALWGLIGIVQGKKTWKTYALVVLSLLLAGGLYAAKFKTSPNSLFQPELEPTFARGTSDALPPETLIMGIRSGDQARAYPLRLLAFHHQVTDTLDGQPLWVTYCTMCRTGKIFRAEVDGEPAEFELIGALRYNSVYKDNTTGTFWYQANGKGAAGPLEGETLTELRADQMTLGQWLEMFPDSDVLQPNPKFAEGYTMFGFSEWDSVRSNDEALPGWQWVVALTAESEPRAYTWSHLAGERLILDQTHERPVAIHLLEDGVSVRAWERRLDGRTLDLTLDVEHDRLVDAVSGTAFGFDGVGQGGALDGRTLQPVLASVEYRHSFETFYGGEIVEPPPAPASEESPTGGEASSETSAEETDATEDAEDAEPASSTAAEAS